MKLKAKLTYLVLVSVPIMFAGCQATHLKQEWLDMLSTNGLAVVFAMFTIFIIIPAIGITCWHMVSWIGKRVDKLIDSHCQWMDRLVDSNEEMCSRLSPLVDKITEMSYTDKKKFEKLVNMHKDIENTSSRVKEIHEKVILKSRNGD